MFIWKWEFNGARICMNYTGEYTQSSETYYAILGIFLLNKIYTVRKVLIRPFWRYKYRKKRRRIELWIVRTISTTKTPLMQYCLTYILALPSLELVKSCIQPNDYRYSIILKYEAFWASGTCCTNSWNICIYALT